MIVNQPNIPAKLLGVRLKTKISDRNWVYDIRYTAEFLEDIQAVEVRFIPFNIWGEKDRALSSTKIMDIEAGTHELSGTWRILSENDAIEHFAMVAYISQVYSAHSKTRRFWSEMMRKLSVT